MPTQPHSIWHNYWALLCKHGMLVIECQNAEEAYRVRRAMSNIKRRNQLSAQKNLRLASDTDENFRVRFWLHEPGTSPHTVFL